MALLDLKTDLKDLKFGNDERGGGNSGQPYVATRIPATNEALQTGFSGATLPLLGAGAGAAVGAIGGSILGASGTGAIIGAAAGLGAGLIAGNQQGDSFRIPTAGTGGPDFLVRGGTLLPNIIVNDEIRLAKFFASTEGLLFTVKQNLLSRLAVKTQVSPKLLNGDVYTPLSSLIEAAGIPFGIHVNKQGLNPFEETGAYSTNQSLYGVKINSTQPQKENRLVELYGAKFLYANSNNAIPEVFLQNNISPDPLNILSYSGGPDSPLGIGKTQIRAANNLVFKLNADKQLQRPNINYLTFDYWDLNTELGNTDDAATVFSVIQQSTRSGPNASLGAVSNALPAELPTVNVFAAGAEGELNNPRNVKSYIPSSKQIDFRKPLLRKIIDNKATNTLISKAPLYNPGYGATIEQRTNLGDPGNATDKDVTSYTNGTYSGAASKNSFDKINALPIYKKDKPAEIGNDLINFRIGVIDIDKPGGDKTYIHFRAFLDQISDSYTSDWNSIKYLGRGENFYNYQGFDRKVSLSWTVAAQSKVELIPMYKKLNYLASLCTPDYSAFGYMRGNIVTLTIGGYFYEQPGIITGLSYEMNDENSSWEIAINDEGNPDPSVKQLPHLIKVRGFEFIPIHPFIPRKQVNTLNFDPTQPNILESGNNKNIYGDQRYIALVDGTKVSNYGDANSNPTPPPTPLNTPRYA